VGVGTQCVEENILKPEEVDHSGTEEILYESKN
jgi:hypothetical protein